SRRRHSRFSRDWSSDVCSSDLKIPADGRVIDANHIQIDESMLTGESLPVHKHAAAINGLKQIYDQENMLFKGTYVHGGSGLMVRSEERRVGKERRSRRPTWNNT